MITKFNAYGTKTAYGITYTINKDNTITINGTVDPNYSHSHISIGAFETLNVPFKVRLYGLPEDVSTEYLAFGGGSINWAANNTLIGANKDITVKIMIYKGYTFNNVTVAARLVPECIDDYLTYKSYSMDIPNLSSNLSKLYSEGLFNGFIGIWHSNRSSSSDNLDGFIMDIETLGYATYSLLIFSRYSITMVIATSGSDGYLRRMRSTFIIQDANAGTINIKIHSDAQEQINRLTYRSVEATWDAYTVLYCIPTIFNNDDYLNNFRSGITEHKYDSEAGDWDNY